MTKSYVSTANYTAFENLVIVGNWNANKENVHDSGPDNIRQNFYGLNQSTGFPEKLVRRPRNHC